MPASSSTAIVARYRKPVFPASGERLRRRLRITISADGLFRRIFPWKSDQSVYRTVELAKAGFSWPPAYLVERNMTAFEHDLLAKKTPCALGPLESVLTDVAEVHAELLLNHINIAK